MTKYVALLFFLLLGCDDDRVNKQIVKNKQDTGLQWIRMLCINKAAYYEGSNFLTPAYNTDGTLKVCKD